ncbi:MAG: hypothetical protein L6R38_004782 [Xanthoria sp. 2 TBL-2021]|nr:MAG: hypothetical protein L6R38_004782 [Xanthoria sp. 2 TBL-2021]
MNCQKCRTPLKLDSSLQDLHPSAAELLTGSSGHAVEPTTATSRTPFPQDRKDLYDKVSQDASPPTFKRVIPPARHGISSQPAMAAATKAGLKDNPAMSFVMLTDSQVVSPQAGGKGNAKSQSKSRHQKPNGTAEETPDGEKPKLSQQIESTTRLFEILSARSDIDHPICTECTDLLLSQLQSRLSSATKERDTYISFLKSLNTTTPTSADLTKAQKSLAEARTADAKAFSDLLALEKEKAALDAEIASLEAESLALDAEEQDFWRSRNAFALTLSEFQNERDALSAAYDHDAQQLERLQRTNVYNDCFCISHDGHFGTINGLRLGRLPPPQNVDWPEINAALGTAALLLATVAQKLDVEFQGMRIKPMGSTSRIEKFEYAGSSSSSQSSSTATITPNATARSSKNVSPSQSATTGQQQQPKAITNLDLFSSGDLPLGANRIIHRRLDAGLVAFLDCIRQLGEYVEMTAAEQHQQQHKSPSKSKVPSAGIVKLPYPIDRDKVYGVSIKLAGNTDEGWTRACKYALTCCKFLLAHASNVGSVRAREGS